ncbi:MAG: hypothetical protein ACYT04_74115, partial [Nostoc sp.]
IHGKIPYNHPVRGGYTEDFCIISSGFKKEVFRISRKKVAVMLDILGFRKRLYGNFPYNK